MNNKTISIQPFKPPWYLRNQHIQTSYSQLCKPSQKLAINWEIVQLPDGDFIELAYLGKSSSKLMVIICGLTGSASSSYAIATSQYFVKKGWQVVIYHYRSAGRLLNHTPKAYHAAATDDFIYAFLLNIYCKGMNICFHECAECSVD